jgi:hypothetical protein
VYCPEQPDETFNSIATKLEEVGINAEARSPYPIVGDIKLPANLEIRSSSLEDVITKLKKIPRDSIKSELKI